MKIPRTAQKWIFRILSFTWGLPMTLCGLIALLTAKLCGCKIEKFWWCWHVTAGKNWGGCSLGPVFFTDDTPSLHTCRHECGHSIQNCLFGPLMPFLVCIPSAVRYWLRRFAARRRKSLPPYDSIWFEKMASEALYGRAVCEAD